MTGCKSLKTHCQSKIIKNMLLAKLWLKLDRERDSQAFKINMLDFPGGAVVGNPPANAGDTGSSPGPGRSHMPWSN